MAQELEKLVNCLVCGMSQCTLDPGDQQTIHLYAAEAIDNLKALRAESSLNITLSDSRGLLINDNKVPLNSPGAKKLFLKMRQKGIERVIIGKGVKAEELKLFFADLASSGGGFHSYAHIMLSSQKGQTPETFLHPAGPDLQEEVIQVKRIYRDISLYKNVAMPTVDIFVGGLMKHVRRQGDVMSMLIPMTMDRDDLYVHSANVALLSVYQGAHLGFGSSLLHDIGLAAALHDIGKTVLPRQILEKWDSLSEDEWAIMKKHTQYGAVLLSSLKKIPDIAIVVALEHHLRYDGGGYPAIGRRTKRQHIISQIVAISDFCCALNAALPHRKRFSSQEILSLLTETAGKEFNPLLVDNLVCILRVGKTADS